MYILSPRAVFALPYMIFAWASIANAKSPYSEAANSTNCTYATRAHISSVFGALVAGDGATFFASVVDNVNWNVQGSQPFSGMYNNKTIFMIDGIQRFSKIQDSTKPHTNTLVNIVGGCNEEWSVQEVHQTAYLINGTQDFSKALSFNF
jgi:hypothetical protein